jgi:hypothetical protein
VLYAIYPRLFRDTTGTIPKCLPFYTRPINHLTATYFSPVGIPRDAHSIRDSVFIVPLKRELSVLMPAAAAPVHNAINIFIFGV